MDHPPPSQNNNAPQIRSRITVVCAECKRLKLKCDRRSPCSSCTKRDTVARCIYSPAAAEKVDLHSLNNRLMQVEATLAQITAGTFQSTYPPSHPAPPLVSSAANPPPNRAPPSNHHHHHHHPAAVSPHVHDAPCPLALSLDELRSAWLDSADSGRLPRTAPARPPHPIKLELSPADIERQMRLRSKLSGSTYPHSRHPNPQPFLPPVNMYYPPLTQPYGSPSYTTPIPSLTPSVLDCLPSTPACIRILARAKSVIAQRPIPLPGGWARFEQKAVSLLSNRTGASYPNAAGASAQSSDAELDSERPHVVAKEKKRAEEGLPFFAITTAVLAIGASVSPPEVFGSESINAGFLHALSQQALSVWESSSAKKAEKDYVLFMVACLSGIGYLLLASPDNGDESKDQEGGKPRAISSLVGKMVSIAREIGLGKEKAAWQEGDNEPRPSSRPDARRAWEDFRRVVWFDVMFYDLFTSDALGHPSLIPPMSYSSRLPELAGSLYDSATKKYVLARCRLVQLAQRVRHRLSHPDCCCGYTFDQAAALEDDIRRWSRESISQDDEEKSDERRHSWELSLAAQVLILRVYVPFLISASSAAAAKRQQQQATNVLPPGSNKVPGKPSSGYNEKPQPQIQGNAMAMATQSCLGAAQAILRLGNKLNVSLFKDQAPNGNSLVGPLLMDLYPLERMVLDAVVITQSSTAVSVVSEAEVRRGMEIMMDREFALGKERKEIWETMKQRVLVPGKLQIPTQGMQSSVAAAMKRKHDQLSPVSLVPNGNDVMPMTNNTTKKSPSEGPTAKHAKTSAGPLPIMGVRYRQGRMGPSGPIRQGEYEGRGETTRSYTLSNAQNESSMNVPAHMQQPPSRHVVSYDPSSPPEFGTANEQAALNGMPVDHTMTGHRSSFDQTQSKAIYNFEEGPMPSPYPDYGNNGATNTHPNSSSPSPYLSTTPSYNPPHFGGSPDHSSNRTPTSSQLNIDSPTTSYGSCDGSTGGSQGAQQPKFGPPEPQRPTPTTFENPRPTFMTENPQPQVFVDKMPPPSAFPHSGGDQSPVGESLGNHHESAGGGPPPQFGVGVPQQQHDTGYMHHPYDTGGMLQMAAAAGMRMDESVPSTPIYEKPHLLPPHPPPPHHQQQQQQQHQMMQQHHAQHSHSHSHSMFVGDHQAWAATAPPPHQQLVGVGVPAGQPYW